MRLIFNIMTLECLCEHGGAVLMIVCHCARVCDRTIRTAVREGACSEQAVADACLAGSMCGGCVPAVTEIIEEEQKSHTRLPMYTSAA
jgi:bacterioferritin-associated ferredoxin